jgi:hypothetical protein
VLHRPVESPRVFGNFATVTQGKWRRLPRNRATSGYPSPHELMQPRPIQGKSDRLRHGLAPKISILPKTGSPKNKSQNPVTSFASKNVTAKTPHQPRKTPHLHHKNTTSKHPLVPKTPAKHHKPAHQKKIAKDTNIKGRMRLCFEDWTVHNSAAQRPIDAPVTRSQLPVSHCQSGICSQPCEPGVGPDHGRSA